MTQWKKFRRLSMDLKKDRGGHVYILPITPQDEPQPSKKVGQ